MMIEEPSKIQMRNLNSSLENVPLCISMIIVT
jgi:hypothetical protein